MEKPFSSLPIWAVILIAFGIALIAGFVLKHLCTPNLVMREDGRSGYLHWSFWKPLKEKEIDKLRDELKKLEGKVKQEEKPPVDK